MSTPTPRRPERRARRCAGSTSRGRPKLDFGLTELQESVRREARGIAAQFPLEYWAEHDRLASYPWEFVRAFADAGWLGVLIPEAYGGAGLGLTEAGLLLQAIGRIRSRYQRRGGDPLLRLPADTHRPPRLRIPEADVPAARCPRRDAGGLRGHRADRRHRHLAHRDAART